MFTGIVSYYRKSNGETKKKEVESDLLSDLNFLHRVTG